ncbi:MAG: plasmid pRiA4b ORF-3 family protein [Deltaproteobacteria bacterium]|nr:plasmid pRiA4b ORF-3 family protein [Deltaproteobacteria bacterium]
MTVPLYLFRIELKEIKPKIWRRFFVPCSISLATLHEVIQLVMGWLNYHLYSFTIFGVEYVEPDPEGFKIRMPKHVEEVNLSKVNLNYFQLKKGSTIDYRYDFGDDWMHQLKLLDTDYKPTNPALKFDCLDGARRCPIEDSGGVYGYYRKLKILADETHEEYEEILAWAPKGYDPEKFNIKKAKKLMAVFRIKYTLLQLQKQSVKVLVSQMVRE